jgi:hypothetical protein
MFIMPIAVATVSKRRTVLHSLNTGVVGLNPAEGIDILSAFYCVVLSSVGRGHAKGWSPV